MTEPLLSVRDLTKYYSQTEGLLNREVGQVKAVDGISLDISPGETVGIVGESGCGKSTAASAIVRLEEPTAGEVIFRGGSRTPAERRDDGSHPNDVTTFDRSELKRFRRNVQMIFQDPASSFNPRQQVGDAVGELLAVHGMDDRQQRRQIVEDLLTRVGLSAADYDRYPHEFSGGEKQRIAIARALVLNPDLIIADEPVSALDVSVQAEVLSLIDELQQAFGLSIILISHDMAVVNAICDRVAVMYLGEFVETGPVDAVLTDPQHPYTETLVAAIPTPDPTKSRQQITLPGTVPSPADPPSGCRFHTRCPKVIQPDDLDLDHETWLAVHRFRQAIAAGSIDLDDLRDTAAKQTDEWSVAAQLRESFDLPAQFDDETVATAVTTAITHLVDGSPAAAAAVLADVFQTPCEATAPAFTDHGGGHQSACLLHTTDENSGSTDE